MPVHPLGQAGQPDHGRGVLLQLAESVLSGLHLGQPLVQPADPGLRRVARGADLLFGLLGAGQGARRGLRRRLHRTGLPGIQAGQLVSGRRGPQRGQGRGPPGHLLVEHRLVPRAEQRRAGLVRRGEVADRRLALGALTGPPLIGQRSRQLVQGRGQGTVRLRRPAQSYLPLRHRRVPLGGAGQLVLQLAQLRLRGGGLGLTGGALGAMA